MLMCKVTDQGHHMYICEFSVTTRSTMALLNHPDSPYDETCDDSSPGDTAGIGPFGVFIHVPLAATQTDKVYSQNQQAQTQTHCTNTCQKYQRLRHDSGEREKGKRKKMPSVKVKTKILFYIEK